MVGHSQRRLDDRIHQPAGLVVDVDELLAGLRAVEEGHDPSVTLESRLSDESWGEPVDGAEVADCSPDFLWASSDEKFGTDGSHGAAPVGGGSTREAGQ